MTGTMAPADHYTTDDLNREMEKLKSEAAATGGGSLALDRYASHFTMLAYRLTDGPSEIHAGFADMFYVVRGKATLLTGGTIPDAVEQSPGEVRGKTMEGGVDTALAPGDVVTIPAGTTHQIVVPPGGEILYFVVKIKAAA